MHNICHIQFTILYNHSYNCINENLSILHYISKFEYNAVQDQGQFGLHLLFCHKNSHWRSLNDYILIKKVKAVLETNGKQFMGNNWQFIWFLFEINGENKSKMVVKKVTNEIQNIICNFCFGCKIDKKMFV